MQGDGSGRGMPQWVVSLIIMASCAALSLVMLAINRLVRYVQMRNAGAPACPPLPLPCLQKVVVQTQLATPGPCSCGPASPVSATVGSRRQACCHCLPVWPPSYCCLSSMPGHCINCK